MKRNILLILTVFLLPPLHAQKKGQARTDSLLQVIRSTKQDTTRVNTLNVLAVDFSRGKPDSAIELANTAIKLAQKIRFAEGEANGFLTLGQVYNMKANTTEALNHFGNALKIYESITQRTGIAEVYYNMGIAYQRTNYEEAIRVFKKALQAAQQSGNKNLMGKNASVIANTYLRSGDYETAPLYNDQAKKYYAEAGNQVGLANTLVASARINQQLGNTQQALKDNYAALRIYEQGGQLVGQYNVHTGIGLIYEDQKNYSEALKSHLAAKKVAEEQTAIEVIANANNNVGNMYRELGRLDEALKSFEESLRLSQKVGSKKPIASSLGNIGTVYSKMGKHEDALKSYREAMKLFEEIGAKESLSFAYYETGDVYFDMKKPVESRQWFEKALKMSLQVNSKDITSKSYEKLMRLDSAAGDFVSALNNYKLYVTYRDSISNAGVSRQLIEQKMQYSFSKKEDSLRLEQALIAQQLERQTLLTKQQEQALRLKQASLVLAQREKDLQMMSFLKTQAELQLSNSQKEKELQIAERETALKQSQLEKQTLLATQKEQSLLIKDKELAAQRSWRIIWTVGAIGLLMLSFFIFRIYRNQRKANERLREQQTKTELALKDLKAAQAQLIQAEKMASLGELTAGIAHEIQNPLNFVNNFAELNDEMIDEMKEEILAGNTQEAIIIAAGIKENNAKINHHGTRADAIVKGMLQHSRTGSSKKEAVDINALTEEYLRLSYHGLRAKDKEFSSNFKAEYDQQAGILEIVPQDIGRVLLNLYNNAFYSVNEKKKILNGAYEPSVVVSTKRSGNKVEISVRDNGVGIPKKMLDKIYQPFFTTKPTGKGTGLGLSLSYDIIKAHGGELKVYTKEGEFAEFKIQLPVS